MSSLKTNIGIYFFSNITVALIPFFLLPILTRYIGPEGYGVIAVFTTFTSMISTVIGLNSHNILTIRWYDKDQIEFQKYIMACFAILIFSDLLMIVIFYGLKDWLLTQLSIRAFWLYAAIIISTAAFITQIRLSIWQFQEKSINYGSTQFGQSLINGLLSYALVVVFLNDYEGRLWGQVVSVVFIGLVSFFSLYKEGLFALSTKWKYIKNALLFGVPLVPHLIGGFFLLMADRMIVNAMLGPRSAGIYMVAVQIALGFNLLNEAINKAFVPRLYAHLAENGMKQKIIIVKSAYIYFMLLAIAPLFSIFLGKYVIEILAGPKFSEASPVLNWLILMQSFHGMYYLVTNYLFYTQKSHITAIITMVCGSLNLVLTIYFVDALGLVGAGISSAIGMFLQFILTWTMAARVYPMPWFSPKIFQIG